MKASELRIGNYVMDGHDVEKVNYIMIEMLVKNQAEFDSIPLTEEWLVKFGFKIEGDNGVECSWIIGRFRLCSDATVFIEDKNNIDVKYVHQLQNLYFALTCEELKLKEDESIR